MKFKGYFFASIFVFLFASRVAMAMITPQVLATCIFAAGQTYAVQPAMLLGILNVEGGRIGESDKNSDLSYSLGPMKVSSYWVTELAKNWGVSEVRALEELRDDACINIGTGAWLLHRAMDENNSSNLQEALVYYPNLAHHNNSNAPDKKYKNDVLAAMERYKDVQKPEDLTSPATLRMQQADNSAVSGASYCACPFSVDKNGKNCGKKSQYWKNEKKSPGCYDDNGRPIVQAGIPKHDIEDVPTKITDALIKKASSGDAKAQYQLGMIYLKEKNNNGIEWLKKAAWLGNSDAQYELGNAYATGKVINHSNIYLEAVNWWAKSAKLGNFNAEKAIAEVYEGKGLIAFRLTKLFPPDAIEAFKWRSKLATQGDPDSEYILGVDYRFGVGTAVDVDKGIDWYHKAAEQGNAYAILDLANVYTAVKNNPVYAEDAVKYFRKSEELGRDIGGFYSEELALIYSNGKGSVKKDEEEAIKWHLKAIEKGNSVAPYNLALIYYNDPNRSVEEHREVYRLLEKASASGVQGAAYLLGAMYAYGPNNFSRDFSQAATYLQQAASQGDTRVKDKMTWPLLSIAAESGDGIYVNIAEAIRDGDVVKAWTMSNFKTPKRDWNGTWYNSSVSVGYFNCAKKTASFRQNANYTELFAEGTINPEMGTVATHNFENEFHDVYPGSIGEQELNYVCARK